VYPYDHRKHIFISLGGYWPYDYAYRRYYWYGWYPYTWYGYYPPLYPAYGTGGDTYNYYTYNYDGTITEGTAVDENTYADVRERMAQQAEKEPAAETEADRYFDAGVRAFETGDYSSAGERFRDAIAIAPEDIVLPFTYVQALFAEERYDASAAALRETLSKIEPEKLGVFFPRGLYADEETLMRQIERLEDRAKIMSSDSDLQLLLGYQLIGTNRHERAEPYLRQASGTVRNGDAANTLLGLLEKIRTESKTETTVEAQR
jgi:tetratricopeptide (TPR) repeat protein